MSVHWDDIVSQNWSTKISLYHRTLEHTQRSGQSQGRGKGRKELNANQSTSENLSCSILDTYDSQGTNL